MYQWSAAASITAGGAVGSPQLKLAAFHQLRKTLVSSRLPLCADAIVRFFMFTAGLEALAKFRAEASPDPLLHTGIWLQPLKTRRLVRLWSLP